MSSFHYRALPSHADHPPRENPCADGTKKPPPAPANANNQAPGRPDDLPTITTKEDVV